MSKVTCGATNCSYNQEHSCCANTIKIGGQAAVNEQATCCASFLNKSAYSNLAEYTSMRGDSQEVLCNVATCKHNKEEHCSLKKLEIGGDSKTLIYTETDCLSFEKLS